MVQLLILMDTVEAVAKNQDVLLLSDDRGDLESHALQTTTQTAHAAHTTDGNTTRSCQTVSETTTGNNTNHMSQAADTNSLAVPVRSTLPSRHSDAFTASPVRPNVAHAVSETTNTELLEMLTRYEELGKRLRQGVMVPATQPESSPSLSAQASKSHSDSSYNYSASQSVVQPAPKG